MADPTVATLPAAPDAEASSSAPQPTTPPRLSEDQVQSKLAGMSDDARMDAVYDSLSGGVDLGTFLAGEPEAAGPGPTNGATPPRTDGTPGEPASQADVETGAEPEVTRDKAVEILVRDGWKAADLATLPDSLLVERATHRRKVQADGDRLGNDHHETRERLARLEGMMAAGGIQPGQPTDDAPPPGSVDPRIDALANRAQEELGEEFAKDFRDVMSESRQELRQLRLIRHQEQMRVARSELTGDYPQLGEDGEFAKVYDRMAILAGSTDASGNPAYGLEDQKRLMADAALLTFGTDIRAATQARMMQQHTAQANGQPAEPDAPADEPAVEPSPEDRMDAAFDLLEKGVPASEARARAYARA